MNEEFEMLDLDGLEFEEIERTKFGTQYGFPTITVSNQALYCNGAFSKHLTGVRFIKYRTSPEYVVICPAEEKGKTAFTLGRYAAGRATTIPANLKEKKIKRGVYKIYKYKDAFAFKRYEPLETF